MCLAIGLSWHAYDNNIVDFLCFHDASCTESFYTLTRFSDHVLSATHSDAAIAELSAIGSWPPGFVDICLLGWHQIRFRVC